MGSPLMRRPSAVSRNLMRLCSRTWGEVNVPGFPLTVTYHGCPETLWLRAILGCFD